MSRILKSGFLCLVAMTAMTPVSLAQTSRESASVRVVYGDLDMSTEAGGKILLRRISVAARDACARVTERSPLEPQAAAQCTQQTVASTVRGLNIAVLTAALDGEQAPTTLASR